MTDMINRGDISFINQNYESAIAFYDRAMDDFENLSLLSRFRLTSHRLGACFQLIIRPAILGCTTTDAHEKEMSHSDSLRLTRVLGDARKSWDDFSSSQPELSELVDGEVEMYHSRMAQCYYVLNNTRDSMEEWNLAIKASASYDNIQSYLKCIDRCNSILKEASNSVDINDSHKNNRMNQWTSSSLVLGSPTPPKYQYYQTDSILTIAILEPNLSQECLHVSFEGEQKERIKVTLTKNGFNVTVLFGRLFDQIDAARTKIKFLEDKCLIKLKKLEPFQWHELFSVSKVEDRETKGASQDEMKNVSNAKSLKTKPYASNRDWDSIERCIKKDEENEKPEGEEALNNLFRDIYGKADDNTRRAMIKSFQTSGGTVLSTNWDEVSKKDYEKERQAPKGMEWKNWEGKRLDL